MNEQLKKTANWIDAFVIGYNLCPFAAKPFNEGKIKYVLEDTKDLGVLVEKTFLECVELQNIDPKIIETTVIVHPNILTDFHEYISVLVQMQEDLEKLELDGIIQLATFHPDYQFEDTDINDPENFTNRSPFPMIHILRENSVEKAIASHPNTEKIPHENIKTMNAIGAETLISKRNEIIGKN